MNERKNKLLNSIIDEYISSAEPVGSSLLVEKYRLNVSPATVRNDMMELENDGYIYQPHTSSGRVPTENGYKFYVENLLKKKTARRAVQEKMEEALSAENLDEMNIKNVAKILAHESNETAIIAFEAMDVYYTGISNLFSQPEFYEHTLVCNLSEVIDQMDMVVCKSYNKINEDVNILIGEENPFSKFCGSVMTKI
ncbi:DeoR family transcriptional regulator, partial [Patescibacteria group bacterium]